MAAHMSKSDILTYVATEAKLKKADIVRVFDLLETLAAQEAKHTFILPNFGKLSLVDRKARTGRNPQTGAPIEIPAKRVVKFRLSKKLKDAVLLASL